MKRQSETISFRVSTELARQLDNARQNFEISRGDWVRGLVQNHLFHTRDDDVEQRLQQVEETLSQLKSQTELTQTLLKQSLYALLTIGCGVSAENAKQTVRKVFFADDTER